jgi:hypothetical protein
MENLIYSNIASTIMKIPLILALLAVATYVRFYDSASTTLTSLSAARPDHTAAVPAVTIAAAPSSYDRWKTGPNAQTDLKTGPNAQTDLACGPNAQTAFQPFMPSEHATWNQTPGGYTVVSGRQVSGRQMSRRMR